LSWEDFRGERLQEFKGAIGSQGILRLGVGHSVLASVFGSYWDNLCNKYGFDISEQVTIRDVWGRLKKEAMAWCTSVS
jgi:hypothetical protein